MPRRPRLDGGFAGIHRRADLAHRAGILHLQAVPGARVIADLGVRRERSR